MVGLFEELGISEQDIKSQQTPEEPVVSEAKPMLFDELGINNPTPEPVQSKPLSEMPQETQEEVEFTQEQTDQLAASVFSPEELEAIKSKGKIGFFEAGRFLDWEDVVPLGGLKQAEESYNLLDAAEKLKNGEELSPYQDELMTQFIKETVEKNIRGFSIPGGIAHGGSQVPAFALEFWASGGVGKSAQKAVSVAAHKAITNRVTSVAAGIAANVATRTALMPAQYAPKYAEERLNNFTALTDKGSIVWQEGTDSPAKSALKAFGHTSIEVGSEMSGAALGKYIVKPVTGALKPYLKTPISSGVQKLPAKVRNGLYQAYRAINPNAKVTEVFSNLGWNGLLEELGEERIAQVMSETLDLSLDQDMTVDDWLDGITPSKEDLLIEAGIISMFGGVKGSAAMVSNMLQTDKGMTEQQAAEAVENMSETERESYIQENLSVRSETESPEVVPEGVIIPEEFKDKKPDINNDESSFQSAYRDYMDDLGAIRDVMQVARDRGAKVDSSNDAEQFARNSKGVMSTVHYNVRYNTTRMNPETGTQEVTGKGLEAILSDFDALTSTVEPNVDVRREDSSRYGIAMSILDDVEISKTDTDVTITPEQEAQAHADIAELKDKYGDEFIFLQENTREKTEYAQRVAQNLVDSGLLSQEAFDEMVAKRPNYLPLQRIFEENEGVSEVADRNPIFSNVDSTLRKRKGSDREIDDINKSLIKNTARIMDAAARNRVGQQLVQFADVVPEYIQKVNAKPGYVPKGTITVYVDGKPQYYKASPAIVKAMEGLHPMSLTWIQKMASTVTNIVKAGATTFNPNFIVSNPARDVVGSAIVSKGKASPATFAKGIYAQIFKTDEYKNWLKDGGAFDTFMEMSDSGFKKALEDIQGVPRLRNSKLNPIKYINDLNTLMEQAPRIGIHAKLTSEGMEGIKASQYARDLTLDFSRSGFKGKRLNLYWAFLNAGLQGTNKLYRAVKEHPKAVAAWGTATVTVPSVALTGWFLYGADEETREAYLEIPQWQKDLFWILPSENGFKRVPKPFSFGFVFGSLPERLMTEQFLEGNDQTDTKQFVSELLTGIIGSVSPMAIDTGSIFPTIAKPLIELGFNENFFRDTPIYPDWMDRLDPVERKKPSTSETSQSLTELLKDTTGIQFSPAQLDHLIQGYTSSIGRNLLQATDAGIKEYREFLGEDIPEKPRTASDIPIVSAFSVRDPVGSSSQSLNNFYDSFTRLRRTHATYRHKVNNGTLDEAEEYEEENFEDIMLFEEIEDRFYKQIKELNKEAKEIYEDVAMTGDEKVSELSEINKQVTEVAREANEYIKESKEK